MGITINEEKEHLAACDLCGYESIAWRHQEDLKWNLQNMAWYVSIKQKIYCRDCINRMVAKAHDEVRNQ